jgi:heme O synthase-like polyprenyltransferase
VDAEGFRTGRQAVSHALGLLPISLFPFLLHVSGPVYLAGALALGLGYLWCAVRFSRRLTLASARQLFYASILYLPLLLIVMVLDKIR